MVQLVSTALPQEMI